MSTNNSSNWFHGLLPVVYGITTRKSTVTKTSPYEVMFDQAPRCDSEYWSLVYQCDINDEDDLPTPVEELNDEKGGDSANSDEGIDVEVANLVSQLSDDVVSYLTTATPSTSKISSTTATTSSKHDMIRKIASDHYLATANKKMKMV